MEKENKPLKSITEKITEEKHQEIEELARLLGIPKSRLLAIILEHSSIAELAKRAAENGANEFDIEKLDAILPGNNGDISDEEVIEELPKSAKTVEAIHSDNSNQSQAVNDFLNFKAVEEYLEKYRAKVIEELKANHILIPTEGTQLIEVFEKAYEEYKRRGKVNSRAQFLCHMIFHLSYGPRTKEDRRLFNSVFKKLLNKTTLYIG